MLQDVSIQNILTDRMYNDLGFTVRDRLMILVEAQSTWSVNIIVRALLYLAQSYQDRFKRNKSNVYGSKAVDLPEPELYVIYTGEREDHPDTMTLSQEFFGGKKTALDVTVKVLYGDDRQSIIGQYVRFCKVLNVQIAIYGYTEQAIAETIRICKDENVLKDYLISHEQEAVDIMMALFDDDYIQEMYGYEREQKGRKEGRKEGRIEGTALFASLMQKLFADGRIEDARRASEDYEYSQKLFKEYAMIQ